MTQNGQSQSSNIPSPSQEEVRFTNHESHDEQASTHNEKEGSSDSQPFQEENKEKHDDRLELSESDDQGPPEHEGSSVIHLPSEIIHSFEQIANPEAKFERVLQFMQECLSRGGAHHFRQFWEARKYALKVFKESLHTSSRVQLWTQYTELCREARRMKETFDEQSAFLAEQIEIAIQAVEDEITVLPEKLSHLHMIEDLQLSHSIAPHIQVYSTLQNELNFLNAFAVRLSSLKKELVKAEVRLKVKNKLFQHLARVGDALFPRRKELISTVSELFQKDVEGFIQHTFIGDLRTPELFEAREEVKHLQHIAKILTLNTEVFSTTRTALSQCWDAIREAVKERKKAQSEHKTLMRQHRDELLQDIHRIKDSFEKKEISHMEAMKMLKAEHVKMRSFTLSYQDVQAVKGELKAVESLVDTALSLEKQERKEKVTHIAAERAKKVEEMRLLIEETITSFFGGDFSSSEESIQRFKEQLNELQQQLALLKMTKSELAACERMIVDAQYRLTSYRRDHLINLASTTSHTDSASEVQELISREIEELEQQRRQMKAELEVLKKSRGASGHDITQAILINERIEETKARLESVEMSLQDLHKTLEG